MTNHQKWLSRRMYHETFSTPGRLYFNWRGVPNRCKCGCGEVWYDRVSPVNWWIYFNPKLLIETRFLFLVFRPLYSLIWSLPPAIWICFQLLRTYYKARILARVGTTNGTSVAIGIAIGRLLLYGVIAPLVVALWVTTWTLSRIGSVIILVLHLVLLGLLIALMGTLLGTAVIAISMRGLVFVIGGVASVTYSYYPAIGIALIVVGVFVEYERNRRNERHREERLGNLILMLRRDEKDRGRQDEVLLC